MSEVWPSVRLGEVLTSVSRPETVEAEKVYDLLGAHWYAKGLYTKEVKRGAQIKAPRLYRVKQGDFVYNRLFAWKGSFAVASPSNDGCYVSNEFPCYQVQEDSLDSRYLAWYFTRATSWDEALGLSSGSTPTSRNRLKEAQLMAMEIPLPQLSEQRRIVGRLEHLASKVEEARGLNKQSLIATDKLLQKAIKQKMDELNLLTNIDYLPISECSSMSTGTTPPSKQEKYYGGSLNWYTPGDLGYQKSIPRKSKTLSELSVNEGKARVFKAGTVLLVAIGASLGKVGLATEDCSSNQQITGIKFSERVLPEFGLWWLLSLHDDLKKSASQTTLPIINQRGIGRFSIAIPPVSIQQEVDETLESIRESVEGLKQLQAQTRGELDALLPSLLDKAFRGEL